MGEEKQSQTGSFQFLSVTGAYPVPQLSMPGSHQERAGLPGVLTHRLIGGSDYQRRQDQLRPEIPRW